MARGMATAALALAAAALASAQPVPPTPGMYAAANQIINYISTPAGNATAWNRIAYATDTFGPRFVGSSNLESAIDWFAETAAADGLNVTQNIVTGLPKWVRGQEWAVLESPRQKPLHFCGLGWSNNTGGSPITAPVIVVGTYAELQARAAEAVGKIVVFDWQEWQGYGTTVEFRYSAATWAASVGGVGALIKSIAPWGLQTCHTGLSQTASVAAGAISHEDSAQLRRMAERGQAPVVTMYMEASFVGNATSRNLLIDYTHPQAAYPDEYVIVSGHMDSWDIAEGAMDDGGGFMTALEAVRIIAQLGLFSNRTIRAIGWVDEEAGGLGAAQYAADYNDTLPRTSFAMESDTGAFSIYGLSVSAGPNALAQLQALAPLLAPLGSAQNVTAGGADTDEEYLCQMGVPCAALWPYDPRSGPYGNNPCLPFANDLVAPTQILSVTNGYMLYHHTESDTVDKLDPTQLQTVAATNAIWALSVANLPTLMPRD